MKNVIKFFGSLFIMPVIAMVIFFLIKVGVDLSNLYVLLPFGLVALIFFCRPKFANKTPERGTASVVDYTIHAADIDRDECM
ncbi:MAG: hypothetical protein LBT59_09525 [Clostridiales bacterium]|jgi:hypothetical protein|nr:hypothetical protein [Clostridiales bacterium]